MAELIPRPAKFFGFAKPEILLRLRERRHFGMVPKAQGLSSTGPGKPPNYPGIVAKGLVVE
jgi:hypothetical protein